MYLEAWSWSPLICAEKAPSRETGYMESREKVYFNIFVIFIEDTTSILKLVFPHCWLFLSWWLFSACAVAIVATVVVVVVVAVFIHLFCFLVFLFIYLFFLTLQPLFLFLLLLLLPFVCLVVVVANLMLMFSILVLLFVPYFTVNSVD